MATPYSSLRIITVVCSGAFPARSPSPFTVQVGTVAPWCSARTVLYAPRPKSLWKWMTSGLSGKAATSFGM